MKSTKFTRNATRNVTWLLPGLAIKRWLGLILLGLSFLLIGVALLLNLQPITLMIEGLRTLAKYLPSHTSGPILVVGGLLLLYLGIRRTMRTLSSAMGSPQKSTGLLEALYRRKKLDNGPIIVAIGGGTGLSTLLRGLKHYTNNITAIVTVGDDGGSSGRLREEHSIIPPGDIRNCIAALADEEQLITSLFQYRFQTGQGLEGHSFGNLFLTAMCRVTGDMMMAIKESSKVLNIRGQVLPSTLDHVYLTAQMEDGRLIHGESNIPEAEGKIHRLQCEPTCPKALPEALEAIAHADLILMGPGSLYTSVIPNILIEEIAKAVSNRPVPKIYISNAMTQPGETDGYTVADHIQAILDHSHYPHLLDCVVVNSELPDRLLTRYKEAHCLPVTLDRARCAKMGITIIEKPLVDESEQSIIRHQPKRLARAIIHWYKYEYLKKRPPKLKVAVEPVSVKKSVL